MWVTRVCSPFILVALLGAVGLKDSRSIRAATCSAQSIHALERALVLARRSVTRLERRRKVSLSDCASSVSSSGIQPTSQPCRASRMIYRKIKKRSKQIERLTEKLWQCELKKKEIPENTPTPFVPPVVESTPHGELTPTPVATLAPTVPPLASPTVSNTPSPTDSVVHNVSIYDDYFGPNDLLITEGDSVRWNWEANDPHDVNLGSLPNQAAASYNGIFRTPLRVNNYSAEFVFSREFLNAHPAPENVYSYYCAPHWSMGMSGVVRIHRPVKPFRAVMVGWEVVSPSDSDAVVECEIELSGNERSVQVSCAHSVQGAIELRLQRGYLGENGETVCSIPAVAEVISGACELEPGQSDDLFYGGMYVELLSLGYPAGIVRGQIVHRDGQFSISGRVSDRDGYGLAGAVVSDGERHATSNTEGYYRIDGVPNGVYRLSAHLAGYELVEQLAVNPVLINRSDAYLRDFSAATLEP